MKIALRGNASEKIGAGHILRLLSLAQYLVSVGIVPVLQASVKQAYWIEKYIQSCSGLVWEIVEEEDFSAASYWGKDFNAVVIDSYEISTSQLRSIESVVPKVAVILDFPIKSLEGQLAVVPSLNPMPEWAPSLAQRFDRVFFGPRYIPLRQEVILAKAKHHREPIGGIPRVTIGLGGFGDSQFVKIILDTLSTCLESAIVEVFSSDDGDFNSYEIPANLKVSFRDDRHHFVETCFRSQLAVVGCGTTIAELAFLGVPLVCIVVAKNQEENGFFASQMGIGASVVLRQPDSVFALKSAILERIGVGHSAKRNAKSFGLDSKGAERIFDAILRTSRT